MITRNTSYILENCAGHVHMFGGNGGGFFKVQPEIPSTGTGKCLIVGIPITHQEIIQPTVTLDDKRSIYVFGSAWSEASISGMLLMGERSGNGEQLGALLDWYDANRISKLKAPISLSLGRSPLEAYVTGLNLGSTDPNINTQQFSVTVLISKV